MEELTKQQEDFVLEEAREEQKESKLNANNVVFVCFG